MKSPNSTAKIPALANQVEISQIKNENFLNKKRNIIIINQSSSDSEEINSLSKNSSSEKKNFGKKNEIKISENNPEKNIHSNNNFLGKDYHSNLFRAKNKTNINSDDTEIITGMFRSNISRIDLANFKNEKNSKKKIKEKNCRVKELRIKNNYDLEGIFEKNFESLKNLNLPTRSSKIESRLMFLLFVYF